MNPVFQFCLEKARSEINPADGRSVKDYNSFTVQLADAKIETENCEPTSSSCCSKKAVDVVDWKICGGPVVDTVIPLIGQTPVVRLKKIEEAYNLTDCEIYAKLEFMSVGGSVKDRIGRRMIEDAEHILPLKPGDYIIEATSGNTGIALAMMSAVKGYNMICLMPQKMSMEKENCLTALGAHVIRTRSSARWDDEDSHIALAEKLTRLLNENSVSNNGAKAYFLDQYSSVSNLKAHYYETAEEILSQMNNDLDYFIAGTGTGGTFSGTSMRLKKEIPKIKCIAVDPVGSVMHLKPGLFDQCKYVKPFEVEGVGYDFHPSTWHYDVADDFEIVDDYDTFRMARQVIKLEGVLCGGSSGMALAGAIQRARKIRSKSPTTSQQKKLKFLVLFPDSIRNYLSKFVSDDWMLSHNLFRNKKSHNTYPTAPISYTGNLSTTRATILDSNLRLRDAWQKLDEAQSCHAAILDEKTRALLSIISKTVLEEQILRGYDNIMISEICNKNSVYFIDESMEYYLGEIQLILRSQFGEGKLLAPAITILPKFFVNLKAPADPVARRNFYMEQNWSTQEIKLVTPENFIKTQLQKN